MFESKEKYFPHYLQLFKRLSLVYLLFVFSRLLLLIFNPGLFAPLSFTQFLKILAGGLQFDLSALLVVNAPFILLSLIPLGAQSKKWYRVTTFLLFLIPNSIALAGNYADMVYYRFTLKRTTADIFSTLGLGEDVLTLLPRFLTDFWFCFVIWFFTIFLIWLIFKKTSIRAEKQHYSMPRNVSGVIIGLLLFCLAIIPARGGLHLRPINLLSAGKYVTPKYTPLVLNTPFTFIVTIGKNELQAKNYFSGLATAEKIYSPNHNLTGDSTFKKNNIVIIILESFSREHIGSLNPTLDKGKYEGYTPFLDSLIKDSYLFYHTYANGKRSIEAIPAILSGIPTLMNEPFITSPYSGNRIESLASILKPWGYESMFFHGGKNGTMGFDSYAHSGGFDHYFGRDEYNNDKDYDGKWGIYDEEFLQYTAQKLNTTKTPFVAAIFTLSSHHPYKIPEKHKKRFAKGKLPIQRCVSYTDYSLQKFFETVAKMPWFKNTIFVITSDHTSEAAYAYYKNGAGVFAIPLIFYKPDSNLKGVDFQEAQQVDIMPSLLGLLSVKKSFIAYGNNLFDPNSPRFSMSFYNNNYQLYKNGHLLFFDGQKATGFYDLRADSLLTKNLVRKGLDEKTEIERFTKAIIQSYNYRVINNMLVTDY